MAKINNSEILEVASLQHYFYQNLSELNKKSLCPVPEEMIYYSSTVMDKFCESQNYFEVSEGKIQEKILGLKILEASQKSSSEQKRILRDVGDTALLVCGYFSSSFKTKMLNNKYYIQLGQMAYDRLNTLSPELLNMPCFYKLMATSFESLTTLISVMSRKNEADPFKHLLIEDYDDHQLHVMGVEPCKTDKAS